MSDDRNATDLASEELSQSDPVTVELSGISVCNGLVLGQAQLLSEGELEIPHFSIEKAQTRAEFTRLRAAIAKVAREFEDLATHPSMSDAPSEATAFIELHRQILSDESLITDTQAIIRERLINAEWALAIKLEELRRAFEEISDEYLAERVEDIAQVIERVQRVLTGRRRPADAVRQAMSDEKIVLIASEMSPADILILKRRRDVSVAGLVVESGSANSHTAILARSLEIPTLVNVKDVTETVETDDVVLLDADKGTITLNPDPAQLPAVAQRIKQLNEARARQRQLKNRPCLTKDKQTVKLLANIALPEDVIDAVRMGADGIGLFRSEFLFMNRPTLPSEDEQYETYRRVIRAMKGRPVTIRTMDLGGDKMPSHEALVALDMENAENVANPALGRRAIRFCLSRPDVFVTQLKAILRAAVGANVRIMLPMLSRPSEIDITRGFLELARQELRDRQIAYAEHLPLGGMIEVPAVALILPAFLSKLDFVSIGTNDLIQYTLAVDRHDPMVAELYDPLHPAVLSLLFSSIRTALKSGKEISVCGEIAGDPVMARLLLGMGLRHLSMESARILPLKERLLEVDTSEAEKFVHQLRRMRSIANIHKAVKVDNPCHSYIELREKYDILHKETELDK